MRRKASFRGRHHAGLACELALIALRRCRLVHHMYQFCITVGLFMIGVEFGHLFQSPTDRPIRASGRHSDAKIERTGKGCL